MDYKEKYKEALERMRNVIIPPETKEGLQELKETVFPELRESEDEKNWKAVLGYVKDDALRVWLEKQKEQVADESDKIAAAYRLGLADGRKEQKPEEWSEEDESNLQSCIAKIEIDMQRWDNHGKTMVDGDIKLIDWLKALPERIKYIRQQHQWKPTEEQMEAVNRVKKAIGPGPLYDQLGSLLNDLKKL